MNLVNTKPECGRKTLSPMIKEIYQLLKFYFNQNWFLHSLEELPGNLSDMHEIHGLLSAQNISIEDTKQLQHIIILLDHFVHVIKIYLLPFLREKLRISGLVPEKQLKNKELIKVPPLAKGIN